MIMFFIYSNTELFNLPIITTAGSLSSINQLRKKLDELPSGSLPTTYVSQPSLTDYQTFEKTDKIQRKSHNHDGNGHIDNSHQTNNAN